MSEIVFDQNTICLKDGKNIISSVSMVSLLSVLLKIGVSGV